MGEYWKPVNLTRGEFIHPHALDCGLKLSEWNYPESNVWKRIQKLVDTGRWLATDYCVIASDYGGRLPLVLPCYGVTDEDDGFLYDHASEDFKDVSKG